MTAYLVTVVIAGDDAERLAQSIADLAAECAALGEGCVDTHIGGPTLVIRSVHKDGTRGRTG